MPYKDRERQLKAQRDHYRANKGRYLELQRKRRAKPDHDRSAEYAKSREREAEKREEA